MTIKKQTSSHKPAVAAKMQVLIKEAKISALKQVVSEIEQALKEYGFGASTVITKELNLEGKEVTASIQVDYFGSWGQYEGEKGLGLDIETASFLDNTITSISKKHFKFGMGWQAGDDCDIHINIRNCRNDVDTKNQVGFVMPAKRKTKRKSNKPSEAEVKKAKVALVKEVGHLFFNEIKDHTSDFSTYPVTTSGKLNIKDPFVTINIRYLGAWEYCPQRKRLHIVGYYKKMLDHLVEKYTKRYPKFIISWDTDERAWLHVTIRNKQPAKLAMLKDGLELATQAANSSNEQDLKVLATAASDLEYKLRYSHPKSTGCHVSALDWQRVDKEESQANINISIRQYGEYEYQDESGRFNGHGEYFMNDSTFTFFKKVLDVVRKKHPKININWHEGDKEYVYITLTMNNLQQ